MDRSNVNCTSTGGVISTVCAPTARAELAMIASTRLPAKSAAAELSNDMKVASEERPTLSRALSVARSVVDMVMWTTLGAWVLFTLRLAPVSRIEALALAFVLCSTMPLTFKFDVSMVSEKLRVSWIGG